LTIPENFSNEPLWLPVTFDPTNSIFELSGVIKYCCDATAGDEDEIGTASPVTAFDLSVAGLAQEQQSKSANRIVRSAFERNIDISPADQFL